MSRKDFLDQYHLALIQRELANAGISDPNVTNSAQFHVAARQARLGEVNRVLNYLTLLDTGNTAIDSPAEILNQAGSSSGSTSPFYTGGEIFAGGFTLKDFTFSRTHNDIPNIPTEADVARMRSLCLYILAPLKDIIGSFTITSGFRCPALNSRIGGSKTSEHLSGLAVDIVSPLTPQQVTDTIITTPAIWLKVHQVIWEFTWTHVSLKIGSVASESKQAVRTPTGETAYIPYSPT